MMHCGPGEKRFDSFCQTARIRAAKTGHVPETRDALSKKVNIIGTV